MLLIIIWFIFMVPGLFFNKEKEGVEALIKGETNTRVYQNATKNLKIQRQIVRYTTNTLGYNPFDED